ncbi:MAG: hypothetical protein ACI395_06125 [Candidatus Cryptobacteroides sp.]
MEKGRKYCHFIHKTNFFRWVLTIAYIAFGYPALFYGCSSPAAVEVPGGEVSVIRLVNHEGGSSDDGLSNNTDVFVFNDDALKRLDSYQKIGQDGGVIASRSGDKIVVAVSNALTGGWTDIYSYEGLSSVSVLLEDEDPDKPVGVGAVRIRAGSGEAVEIRMRRLLAEIRLTGLRTDFFGTEYEDEPLTDVRAYLTDVNGSCRIVRDSCAPPGVIVNPGRLDELSLSGFRHRELVLRELGDVGRDGLEEDVSLFCYPGDHPEDSPGSPFTKLVIEGKIRGHTYYYPLVINRGGVLGTVFWEDGADGELGAGIRSGRTYCYDITICRSGTDDPDIPVEGGMVRINGKIVGWEEKGNERIVF